VLFSVCYNTILLAGRSREPSRRPQGLFNAACSLPIKDAPVSSNCTNYCLIDCSADICSTVLQAVTYLHMNNAICLPATRHVVFFRSELRFLVTANVVPSYAIVVPLMM
jgi:hypothetical protein